MSQISLHYSSRAPLAGAFTALRQTVGTWRRRARARRELANLDFRTLRDIGVSAGEIQFEANKPFWRD